MTDLSGKNPHQNSPGSASGGNIISAVKFSETLTAEVDAWAEVHTMKRSDAIRELVKLGLNTPPRALSSSGHHDSVDIEQLAVKQIDQLLDQTLSVEERKRRIRRLTDGPPEFADERIDLPKLRGWGWF